MRNDILEQAQEIRTSIDNVRGTMEDADAAKNPMLFLPFPAARGMEYEYGKYYHDPEDGKTYLCKRVEETGSIVLYYLPHELIGQYFEEVN